MTSVRDKAMLSCKLVRLGLVNPNLVALKDNTPAGVPPLPLKFSSTSGAMPKDGNAAPNKALSPGPPDALGSVVTAFSDSR